MNNKIFIESIASYVQKYASVYHIAVCSPIIAQAILESASGTSELAVKANNYFGLKYREGRCKTSNGIYIKSGSEQNADGTYESSVMQWCKFPDMENGVIGYFDFINISNYSNLKGVQDPKTYLENVKSDGYATSLKYVDNLMSVIRKYDLTKYDKKKEENKMSNSPLVSYTKISPNKNSPRKHSIDTITIHCVVGQWTAKQICDFFANPSRKASCTYGVGHDGSIGLCVDEKDRSWCSSSASNDNRAITIEVASDTTHPYAVKDKAYVALVELLVDICKRNGIKKLLWEGNKALMGQISRQNMSVHRWLANKACPGEYLYNRHGDIATRVNIKLGSGTSVTPPTVPTDKPNNGSSSFAPYLVKVTADVLNIRKGAGTDYGTSGAIRNRGTYTIVEEANGVGAKKWGKLKSGAGWISLDLTRKV